MVPPQKECPPEVSREPVGGRSCLGPLCWAWEGLGSCHGCPESQEEGRREELQSLGQCLPQGLLQKVFLLVCLGDWLLPFSSGRLCNWTNLWESFFLFWEFFFSIHPHNPVTGGVEDRQISQKRKRNFPNANWGELSSGQPHRQVGAWAIWLSLWFFRSGWSEESITPDCCLSPLLLFLPR